MINDLSDSPRNYPNTVPAKRVNDELVMNLADLGMRPGDRIAYYATAYDTNPGKPNIGETETYTMKVVTPEEFKEALKQERTAADLKNEFKDIVAAVQDLADKQKDLADRMASLEKQLAQKPGDAALKQKLADARKEQKDLQQQAGKLAQAMKEYSQSPSATPLEAALKEKIAQIAQQIAAAQGSMQKAQSGQQSAASAKSAADQLAKASKQMQDQVQKSIQHLGEIMPLYGDMQRFMDLLNEQGQLVLKAREFQQSSGDSAGDKARMDEIATRQAAIRQALVQLQQDLEHDADTAQEHFPKAAASGRAIAAEIDHRHIPDLMQNSHDGFSQWNGPNGFEAAQNALRQMQAMVSQCQGGQSAGEGELDVALSQSLGKKGLGQSLSGFGMGSGQGDGTGMGLGSMPGGKTGQSGGSTKSGPKAYVPSTQQINGTGGQKKMRHQNNMGAGPGVLAPSDTEVMKNPSQAPQKAGDRANRYPPEYRKMISDYFKSVAEGK